MPITHYARQLDAATAAIKAAYPKMSENKAFMVAHIAVRAALNTVDVRLADERADLPTQQSASA